jgi:hypothetical protein
MSDDKVLVHAADAPEQVKLEDLERQAQDSRTSAAVRPVPRAAPGPRPLFRN